MGSGLGTESRFLFQGSGRMPFDVRERERRLERIRSLLRRGGVRTQGEILEHLARRGFRVTQSSVSRDLAHLGVVKGEDGYRLPEEGPRDGGPKDEGMGTLMLSFAPAGPNLLVVKTVIGGAPRVGLFIDREEWPEVVGTIAGDDTLFVAVPGRRELQRVRKRLEGLAKGRGKA